MLQNIRRLNGHFGIKSRPHSPHGIVDLVFGAPAFIFLRKFFIQRQISTFAYSLNKIYFVRSVYLAARAVTSVKPVALHTAENGNAFAVCERQHAVIFKKHGALLSPFGKQRRIAFINFTACIRLYFFCETELSEVIKPPTELTAFQEDCSSDFPLFN